MIEASSKVHTSKSLPTIWDISISAIAHCQIENGETKTSINLKPKQEWDISLSNLKVKKY